MDIQRAIEEAIQSIQSGDRETGKRLLAQVLQASPQNVQAWLSMSDLVDSQEQRRDCLLQVLALDPGNERAKARLGSHQAASGHIELPTRDTLPRQPLVLPEDTSSDTVPSMRKRDPTLPALGFNVPLSR